MSRAPHHQHSRSFPHNTYHLHIPSTSSAPLTPPTLNIIAPRSPGPILTIPNDTPPASALSPLSPLSPPSPAPQLRARTPNLSLDITGLTVASGPNSASVSSAQASPLMSASTLVFNNGLNNNTMLHPNYLNAPPQNSQSQSPAQSPSMFSFDVPGMTTRTTSRHSRKRSVSGEPRNESPTRPTTASAEQYDILAGLLDGSYMPVSNGVSPGATGSGSPTTTSDPEPDVDMEGDFKDIDMGNGVFGGPSPGSSSAKPSNNNFVTKLFQMINDPKSANFIAWNEHGTSFIVQSVGEFSRSILGSHFKHSNFSSFVRQLNMYGFHKVNKTPRSQSQRTSQDNQTWEFSHPKFLKGRVDLLDQIKRKALDNEPPGRNTRVELPAEVATQLRRMVSEHQSLKHALAEERARVEGLTEVVKMLYDIVATTHPGQMPGQFPNDLLDPSENPPIYITSPPESPLPPPFQLPNGAFAYSPTGSPTSPDFPQHQDGRGHVKRIRVDEQSFGSAGLSLGQHQHHGLDQVHPHPHPQHSQTHPAPQSEGSRPLLRARSDSAPHGIGLGHYLTSTIPQQGRPRSGSSLSGYQPQQIQQGVKDEYSLGILGLDM